MNVIGLISGGKDSILNLVKCHEAGHKIVCLANMCPVRSGESKTTEIDSHCFQSIAQEHVPLIAKCMGLPLYTAELLKDASINTDLCYSETEGDEVECLHNLLQRVKLAHPEANAISTGAIESNFQRFRVLHVCERLQLEHISYLWKCPAEQVLKDVLDRNLKSIIVKVSSMGLGPDEFLGKVLDDETVSKLLKVPYIHAAGEGGEFETFTLDCPLYTRGYLVVKNSEMITLQKSDVVTSAVLNMDIDFVERRAE